MAKRLFILTLVVIFIASVAGHAISAGHETTLNGTISAIDSAAKSVTIKDEKGKETTVTDVDEKSLGELKAGDMVECIFAAEGKKNVFKSIIKKPSVPGYK